MPAGTSQAKAKTLGVLAFDVDGVLALREEEIPLSNVKPIESFIGLDRIKVALITGQQIEKQRPRLSAILRPGLIIYANESTQKYFVAEGGELKEDLAYRKGFKDEDQKKQVKAVIESVIKYKKRSPKTPEGIRRVLLNEKLVIEDRVTQFAFKYNLDHLQREYLAEQIREKLRKEGLANLQVRVSGKSTISVYRSGISKATAIIDLIETLDIYPEEIIYFGDEFYPEGNDRPVISISGLTNIRPG